MTLKRTTLAAIAALTLGTTLGAVQASAQYDRDDYGRRYDRGYDRGYDEDRYERRSRYDEDRYERRGGRGGGGSLCVTARGNCVTRPGPFNAPCGCEVPGFGFKRGAIGG